MKMANQLVHDLQKLQTRMLSCSMRTTRSLTVCHSIQGGLPIPPPDGDTPWMQTPLPDADHSGHVTSDACYEANPYPLLFGRKE